MWQGPQGAEDGEATANTQDMRTQVLTHWPLARKRRSVVVTASLTMLCAKEQGGFIGGHADLPGKGN